MNISYWNVRGLGEGRKIAMVKKLLKGKRMSFIGHIANIWGGSNFNWVCVNTVNTTSGILCMWEEGFLNQVEIFKGVRWLGIKWVTEEYSFHCAFCVVYGPHNREEKNNFGRTQSLGRE